MQNWTTNDPRSLQFGTEQGLSHLHFTLPFLVGYFGIDQNFTESERSGKRSKFAQNILCLWNQDFILNWLHSISVCTGSIVAKASRTRTG